MSAGVKEASAEYRSGELLDACPVGYKRTEVGIIPQDWEVVSANNVVKPSMPICYGVVQVGRDTNDGVPIVAIKYVKEISVAPLHKTALHLEHPYIRSRVKGGDVLISIKGTIGRVGIVPEGFVGNISRELARLSPKEEYSAKYIAHQLESVETQARISRAVVGTTRLEFSIAELRQFELPIPLSLAEQTAIANALSDVDSLITSLETLITKKRAIKTAAMQQLLTGRKRLPPFDKTHTGYKQTELGEIPEDWEVVDVRSVISNYFCGPSPTCEERNIHAGSEWGVLKTTCATVGGGWNWRKHKLLPKDYWGKADIELTNGDVIVTKAGPRHRVGVAVTIDYVPNYIVPSGKMIAVRPIPNKVDPRILSHTLMLKGSQNYLNQRTTGMAEAQLNFENSDLLNAPIIIQSIEEQRFIANLLDDMDSEIRVLEKRLTKTQQLKQGMMQELLTGRTRLL